MMSLAEKISSHLKKGGDVSKLGVTRLFLDNVFSQRLPLSGRLAQQFQNHYDLDLSSYVVDEKHEALLQELGVYSMHPSIQSFLSDQTKEEFTKEDVYQALSEVVFYPALASSLTVTLQNIGKKSMQEFAVHRNLPSDLRSLYQLHEFTNNALSSQLDSSEFSFTNKRGNLEVSSPPTNIASITLENSRYEQKEMIWDVSIEFKQPITPFLHTKELPYGMTFSEREQLWHAPRFDVAPDKYESKQFPALQLNSEKELTVFFYPFFSDLTLGYHKPLLGGLHVLKTIQGQYFAKK